MPTRRNGRAERRACLLKVKPYLLCLLVHIVYNYNSYYIAEFYKQLDDKVVKFYFYKSYLRLDENMDVLIAKVKNLDSRQKCALDKGYDDYQVRDSIDMYSYHVHILHGMRKS